MEKNHAVMEHLGKDAKSKPKKTHVHEVSVKRGASGGFVHTHHHADEHGNHTHTTGPHVMADQDSMHDDLDTQMGDQPDAGAPPAPAAGAPAPGAGAPPAEEVPGE